MKICKKVFYALHQNALINKEKVRLLTLQLEQKADDRADQESSSIKAIISFQAVVRGYLIRKTFQDEKINKLFAIQTIQNFSRIVLARTDFGRRLKKQKIEEKVREDKELELMREADAETRYYLYLFHAAVQIQKLYRGRMGRRIAYLNAVEFFRNRSAEFYVDNKHQRLYREVFLRAAQAKEQLQIRNAIRIEKVVRGWLGRRRYAQIKLDAKIARLVVFVQKAYRRRLAQTKLMALRRDKFNDSRYRAARKHRGVAFRLFGLRKRKQQNIVARILQNIGADPISYNYRVHELISETKDDFRNLVWILRREYQLFLEHGFDAQKRSAGRSKLLAAAGWKFAVKDTVKIVEAGHKYEGYTGVIVRIDDTLMGTPMYEIQLDHFSRQTFVQMTTDPLVTYLKHQPLTKINPVPDIKKAPCPTPIFGLQSADKFYSKKNILAAWKIQRAYRTSRAKMIVGRKRYEHWKQCIARQQSLVNHLSEANCLSSQGYSAAGFLGLKSYRPIRFDEIRHDIIPGRFSSVLKRPDESKVIKNELNMKQDDRLLFLQKMALINKKGFFSTGYEPMTLSKKLSALLQMSYGVFYRGPTRLKDLVGSRGMRLISRKESVLRGLDHFDFKQFIGSSHVRYSKVYLYHGEWSGIPLFSQLRPHGEGMILFLDGWGFVREEKVLYLEILKCRCKLSYD